MRITGHYSSETFCEVDFTGTVKRTIAIAAGQLAGTFTATKQ